MKKYMFMSLFVLSSIMAFGAEESAPFDHPEYSQKDLIKVRLAWAHQENRVGQLKYEASEIASNHVVQYMTGEAGHVAVINANDETITTNIEGNKQVKLSYDDFARLVLPSCPAEIDLIERYTKNYRSAIKDYNELMCGESSGGYVTVKDEQGRQSQRAMTIAEKNALLDAIEAKHAVSLPWGFKWLAAYWVENFIGFDTKFGMNYCFDIVKPVVEKHLAAMIGKQLSSRDDLINEILHHMALGDLVCHFDSISKEQKKAIEQKKPYFREKMTKLAIDRAMKLNQQKPIESELFDSSHEYRQEFCENLLPMIEDRDEHMVRLKAENPVDTNGATNKFAGLFDRIA